MEIIYEGDGYKIAKVETKELRPNEWNFNEMQEEQFNVLVNNVKEGDMLQPVLAQEDGVIIDGEHRWNAVKAAGKTELMAILVKPEQVKAQLMTIGFNTLRGASERGRLNDLIKSLLDSVDKDKLLTETGLDVMDIGKAQAGIIEQVSKQGLEKAKDLQEFLVSAGFDAKKANVMAEVAIIGKSKVKGCYKERGEITGETFPLTFYFVELNDYERMKAFFSRDGKFEPDAKKLFELAKEAGA